MIPEPHLSPKAANVQPVETPEVVEAVASMLAAYTPFTAHLRPSGSLYTHRLPLRDADGGEAESALLWALLREMKPIGPRGAKAGIAGLVTVRMQLQLSLDATHPAARATPDRILSQGHALAYRALVEEPVYVSEGVGAAFSARSLRQTDVPTPAMQDDAGRLYSSAYYAASVYPVPGGTLPPDPTGQPTDIPSTSTRDEWVTLGW